MIQARRLLPGILLIAIALRLWGIGFGVPYANARPDESEIGGPAVGFLTGDLRPPFLQWPTLFAYVVAVLYVLYFVITRRQTGYSTLEAFAESRRVNISPFFYVSRGLSALMGVMTVWWVYALGRRAWNETVGVVAAVFLALAFLHVRDSHFGVTDVAMTALVVLAVLAILRWGQEGGLGRAAAAGLAVGLATSTKYNGLGASVPFAVALVQRCVEERRERAGAVGRAATALIAFIAALALGLFGTSPYILIDWTRFVHDVTATQNMMAHGHGLVLGRGWWYFARVVLPAAVGWPIWIAAISGTLILLVTRFRQSAVILSFPLAYYLVAGRSLGVFARYTIPLIPFVCLTAAWLTVEVSRLLTRDRSPAIRSALVAGVTILMVAPTAYKSVLLDRLLATTDNRTVVGRALVDIIPSGHSFYQSGASYGQAPLSVDGRSVDVHIARFDQGSGDLRPASPDWILVQRSPLVLYSAVPPGLERLLRERYVLVRQFSTGARARNDRVYDQQDAFYLPLGRLEGIRRPGPEFELYARRED